MEQQIIDYYANQVSKAKHCVVMTGAGFSKACGIPTIQTEIEGKPLHVWFKQQARFKYPKWHHRVYRIMLQDWLQKTPNDAYFRLGESGLQVITQNIDGLHKKSESKQVIELHGNLREIVCEDCHALFSSELVLQSEELPICPACEGKLRPNVVLEGEEVKHFAEAVDWVGNADLLLVIGTHLRMEPCNQLPNIVKANNGNVLYINKQAEKIIPHILKFRK